MIETKPPVFIFFFVWNKSVSEYNEAGRIRMALFNMNCLQTTFGGTAENGGYSMFVLKENDLKIFFSKHESFAWRKKAMKTTDVGSTIGC